MQNLLVDECLDGAFRWLAKGLKVKLPVRKQRKRFANYFQLCHRQPDLLLLSFPISRANEVRRSPHRHTYFLKAQVNI